METKPQLDLLLIGKTANGKSATGNSILRRKAFKSSGNTTSVTNTIDAEVAEFDGRIIKVVDAPGVCDNSVDKSEAVSFVMECLQKAMVLNPEGYHAFLLVVKYGNRFTGEEKGTINFLKNAFGENFVRDYCVMVMSGGDIFKNDEENKDITFKKWCRQQTGDFKEILNECSDRIVLFDNCLKDQNKKTIQLIKLIEKVEKLPNKGKRYTDENFKLTKEWRDQAELDAKELFIRQKTLAETGLLIDALDKLQLSENNKYKIEALQKLQSRDDDLVSSIKEKKKKCRRFKDLLETTENLGVTISDEEKLTRKLSEENEKLQRETEAIKEQEKMLERSRMETEKIKEENKRLEALKEQVKLQAELDKAKQEKEEKKHKARKEKELEQERQRKKIEELENKYKEIKEEQNSGLTAAVLTNVLTPLVEKAKSWWWRK